MTYIELIYILSLKYIKYKINVFYKKLTSWIILLKAN
jgi:hypothetical protein